MRVRIWNAYASNNSGSYTIVGSFESPEQAERVAAELAEVIAAHTAWRDAAEEARQWPPEGTSPLEAFIRKNGLHWEDGLGADDDWPQYGGKDGELFYARGGRVDVELNHTHHPLFALLELWISWQEKSHGKVDVPDRVAAVVEALNAEDGPLVVGVADDPHPAWRATRPRRPSPASRSHTGARRQRRQRRRRRDPGRRRRR